MRDVVYEEWVPAGRLMKAFVVFVSLLFLCISFVSVAVGFAIQYPFLIVVLGSVEAFLLVLFWNYRGIQIRVDNKDLVVHYGIFNHKSIPIVDIVSCKPTKASLGRYGGVGVRYGVDGSWAYTTSLGDAVRIITRKARPFVFSSRNPERICDTIDQMKSLSETIHDVRVNIR